MTGIEGFLTAEWNRYTKGKGGPCFTVLLAQKQLFDAFAATVPCMTRENAVPAAERVASAMAFKTTRMYQLQQEGWDLVIEGVHGRQQGTYVQ